MVIEIEIERLRDFHGHPFKVRDDDQMKSLRESIEKYGILTPLIVRPVPEGCYEIISGHRRKYIAKYLGFRKVSVIIRVMKDDEAVIAMVDSNNQREKVTISEKAYAYKMKYDAMKRQSGRRKNSGGQEVPQYYGKKTVQILGKEEGISSKQVQRYLRIPELIPELIKRVDTGELSFNPAVAISYLDEKHQELFLDAMNYSQAKPSLSQAQRMKRAFQEGVLTKEMIREILMEDKNRMSDRVILEKQKLQEFFPSDYSMEMIQKARLIDLRNSLFEYEALLHEMSSLSDANEKEIKQLIEHKCPECGSVITETTTLRSKRYNLAEDIVTVKNELQVSIQNATQDIKKEEKKYQKSEVTIPNGGVIFQVIWLSNKWMGAFHMGLL